MCSFTSFSGGGELALSLHEHRRLKTMPQCSCRYSRRRCYSPRSRVPRQVVDGCPEDEDEEVRRSDCCYQSKSVLPASDGPTFSLAKDSATSLRDFSFFYPQTHFRALGNSVGTLSTVPAVECSSRRPRIHPRPLAHRLNWWPVRCP